MATYTLKVDKHAIVMDESTGRPKEYTGKEKFTMDVRENLDLDTQANGTGAGLQALVGQITDVFSIRAELTRRLTESFNAYRALQDQIQRSDRDASERFGRLLRVDVFPLKNAQTDEFSFTDFAFRIDVLSLAAKAGTTTITGTISNA